MEFENLEKYYFKNNDIYPHNQHNIMVIIGNGFDIGIMNKYYKGNPQNYKTTYSDFYNWLESKNLVASNVFLDTMKKYKNWSNFEAMIPSVLDSYGTQYINKINEDLNYLQIKFSHFLFEIITNDLIRDIGNKSEKNGLASHSLSKFLSDLDKQSYENIKFANETNHHDIFNFIFLNMNFTSLFDNYIYLDKHQFDPTPHKTVKTNFTFYPNPNNFNNRFNWNSDTRWSCCINAKIVHPHGQQYIPRSMLFGSNCERFKDNKKFDRFNKEYWAQYELKYSPLFNQAELYIVYGSAIGESDSWWWKKICESLENGAELIVYSYNGKFSKKDFIQKYAKENAKTEIIDQNIFIVNFTDATNINFLTIRDF